MSNLDNPSPVREADGVQFPAPGTWDIDPDHAEVAFVGRHLMVTNVRGRFTDLRGSIVIGKSLEDLSGDVTIAMASVDSSSHVRDEHLRSPELFDMERFPEATFTSTGASWSGTRSRQTGELTIHGVTRPVVLDVRSEKYARDRGAGTARCTRDRRRPGQQGDPRRDQHRDGAPRPDRVNRIRLGGSR